MTAPGGWQPRRRSSLSPSERAAVPKPARPCRASSQGPSRLQRKQRRRPPISRCFRPGSASCRSASPPTRLCPWFNRRSGANPAAIEPKPAISRAATADGTPQLDSSTSTDSRWSSPPGRTTGTTVSYISSPGACMERANDLTTRGGYPPRIDRRRPARRLRRPTPPAERSRRVHRKLAFLRGTDDQRTERHAGRSSIRPHNLRDHPGRWCPIDLLTASLLRGHGLLSITSPPVNRSPAR